MVQLFRYKIVCGGVESTGITIAVDYETAARYVVEYFEKFDKITIEAIGEFKHGLIPMNEFDIDNLNAAINIRRVGCDE